MHDLDGVSKADNVEEFIFCSHLSLSLILFSCELWDGVTCSLDAQFCVTRCFCLHRLSVMVPKGTEKVCWVLQSLLDWYWSPCLGPILPITTGRLAMPVCCLSACLSIYPTDWVPPGPPDIPIKVGKSTNPSGSTIESSVTLSLSDLATSRCLLHLK